MLYQCGAGCNKLIQVHRKRGAFDFAIQSCFGESIVFDQKVFFCLISIYLFDIIIEYRSSSGENYRISQREESAFLLEFLEKRPSADSWGSPPFINRLKGLYTVTRQSFAVFRRFHFLDYTLSSDVSIVQDNEFFRSIDGYMLPCFQHPE